MSNHEHHEMIQLTIQRLAEIHLELIQCIEGLKGLAGDVPKCDCCLGCHERKVNRRPYADPATLSAVWNGRQCVLGRTLSFRLFEKLARRPNQYVTHERLLQEVWHGSRSKQAIRSLVRELRRRLRLAGMSDLADAIDGSVRECYGLILDGVR